MLALLKSPEELAVVHQHEPTLSPTQVLVRVHVAGVCRTDVAVARGQLTIDAPVILGHEAAGTIVRVGRDVANSRLGQHVAIWPFQPCGVCRRCTSGASARCPHAKMLGVHSHGAFADFVAVESSAAISDHVLLPRELAYAEPVCASLAVLGALNHESLDQHSRVAVIGDNRIAQLTALILRDRLGYFPEILAAESLSSLLDDTFDLLIETAATEQVLREAFRIARPGATVILKSRPAHAVAVDVRSAVLKELTLRAVSYGDFSASIAWIAAHRESVQPLLGTVFALTEFEQAFARDAQRESNKSFLAPQSNLAERW